MTTKQLKNLDHTFDLACFDIGVTIRKGLKWAIQPNEKFHLVEEFSDDKEDKLVGKGISLGFWTGDFFNIPSRLLKMEHNVCARNKEVLFDMMKEGYGDSFDEWTIVTALIYQRIG